MFMTYWIRSQIGVPGDGLPKAVRGTTAWRRALLASWKANTAPAGVHARPGASGLAAAVCIPATEIVVVGARTRVRTVRSVSVTGVGAPDKVDVAEDVPSKAANEAVTAVRVSGVDAVNTVLAEPMTAVVESGNGPVGDTKVDTSMTLNASAVGGVGFGSVVIGPP